MAFAHDAFAGEASLERFKSEALSFFTPMAGTVKALTSDGAVISDIGASSGIKKGMRLSLKRESGTFIHPITKEPVGKTETVEGLAEAEDIGDEGTILKLMDGDARIGDILRLSSAKVRALFHQSRDVDWFAADEYLRRLKETGRFEFTESAPLNGSDEEMTDAAQKAGAEVIIALSQSDGNLGQRLLWVRDGKEFSSMEASLDEEFLKKLKLGEELFTPRTAPAPPKSPKVPANKK